ncbi:MAG: aspartyl protease family protein [Oceanicaulis sp.]|nr:aspartyl protease family protein [Oceanicaulis sp.]
MIRRLFASLLIVAAFGATAFATPDLDAVIDSGDPAAFAAFAEHPETPEAEARLARGALAALRGQDSQAETLLSAALANEALSPAHRRAAGLTLAGVRMRAADYAGAAAAFDAAEAADGEPLESSQRQARDFVYALRAEPPITRGPLTPGSVSARRDMASLPRAQVRVNGRRQEAVLDTAAAFSTVRQSTAARLGLRMLEAEVSVGAATEDAVPARLAVADELDFGGVSFRNVVFIVLPDEALSFAGGLYVIDALVGFPVLSRLERLTVETGGRRDLVNFGPSEAQAETPNLMLEGLRPILLAGAADAEGTLRLLVDSGARSTLLNTDAAEAFPALVETARRRRTTVAGAGGTQTQDDALSIPSLVLTIGGTPVTLSDVRVLTGGRGARHGTLGQDAMRAHGGYVLDFRAMRMELLPAE